jgi:1-acyl-sn-glycerol-3-phosphate acyltransferase
VVLKRFILHNNYDDIRPYCDAEVSDVLKSLLQYPAFPKAIAALLNAQEPLNSDELSQITNIFNNTKTVTEFQEKFIIAKLLHPIFSKTITELTADGLENFSLNSSCLFLSNHRDIIMDPTVINYYLFKNYGITTEIAFGDNLLINPFISAIIRLNKSFIVKRNLPLAKQLVESAHLSEYIWHTLEMGNSVWIAQREGRAKDGNDVTNPALLSMLSLAKRSEKVSVGEMYGNIKIVPVSISYEIDPCDSMKALELYRNETESEHKKTKSDDFRSIVKSISGHKGRVHCSFSEAMQGEFESEKELAEKIDNAIQSKYKLWPNNYAAYDILYNTNKYSNHYEDKDRSFILNRFELLKPEVKHFALLAYSNPVKNLESIKSKI